MIHAARVALAAIVFLFVCAVAVHKAHSDDEPVDLELVLAVDVSWSMDLDEQALQREGYVQAFRDPAVQKAIRGGPHGKIAVIYIEWAGPQSQVIVVPWTVVRSNADADQLAARLEALPISRYRMTSISTALEFSARQFTVDAISGTRRVIDISGDGPNNSGQLLGPVRDRLVAEGIVINGLPITVKPGTSSSLFDIPNLETYYANCVIGGPGSFVIPIRERSEFVSATRQKLLLEIAGLVPSPHIVLAQSRPEPNYDCSIGEQLWRRYMDR